MRVLQENQLIKKKSSETSCSAILCGFKWFKGFCLRDRSRLGNELGLTWGWFSTQILPRFNIFISNIEINPDKNKVICVKPSYPWAFMAQKLARRNILFFLGISSNLVSSDGAMQGATGNALFFSNRLYSMPTFYIINFWHSCKVSPLI